MATHILDGPDGIARLYQRYRDFDLVVDSRLVSRPPRTLFLALAGARTDGHRFIGPLIARGVRDFVVRKDRNVPPNDPTVTYWRVDEPLRALQELAAHHRAQFPDTEVVAVTGSNGKTIVKDWLAQLMGRERRVCSSPRSYNSQIGVALSVWRLRRVHELAIFEAGISQPGEMAALRDMIRPTSGILTHLGTAHLANFQNRRQLAVEKLSLFDGVEWLVLGPGVERTLETYGNLPPTAVYRTDSELPEQLAHGWSEVYRDNLLTTLRSARALGMDVRQIDRFASRLLPLRNRLERKLTRAGTPLIDDSYSNDYTALAAALTFAEEQDPFGNLTVILGTVQPLANYTERLVTLLRDRVHRLILVGEANRALYANWPGARHFPDVDALLRELPAVSFAGTTTLVKGASYQRLDRVVAALSRQQHRTTLQIDLTALRHNLNYYRSTLPAEGGMIVMAKASAYGSGALPVARLLQAGGVDYLAVAYADEGRELRAGGIELPIIVLNADPGEFPTLKQHRLEPVVHAVAGLRAAVPVGIPVHLEVDTGMGRLGFLPGDIGSALRSLKHLPAVASFFTHLAASEDEDQDDFTRTQIEAFEQAYRNYLAAGGKPTLRHLLNTNGISRFPKATYDLVRLGIGLYGIGDARAKRWLHPVLTLTTHVTAVREFAEPATVGYGRRGVISGNRRIAVLAIGYADGLPRRAGEGGFSFKIRGEQAPTIGSVCMDMCTVDVTHIPAARVGEEAIVFGPDHPVEELAASAGTIPYEIMTGIGPRVHRIYRGE